MVPRCTLEPSLDRQPRSSLQLCYAPAVASAHVFAQESSTAIHCTVRHGPILNNLNAQAVELSLAHQETRRMCHVRVMAVHGLRASPFAPAAEAVGSGRSHFMSEVRLKRCPDHFAAFGGAWRAAPCAQGCTRAREGAAQHLKGRQEVFSRVHQGAATQLELAVARREKDSVELRAVAQRTQTALNDVRAQEEEANLEGCK